MKFIIRPRKPTNLLFKKLILTSSLSNNSLYSHNNITLLNIIFRDHPKIFLISLPNHSRIDISEKIPQIVTKLVMILLEEMILLLNSLNILNLQQLILEQVYFPMQVLLLLMNFPDLKIPGGRVISHIARLQPNQLQLILLTQLRIKRLMLLPPNGLQNLPQLRLLLHLLAFRQHQPELLLFYPQLLNMLDALLTDELVH